MRELHVVAMSDDGRHVVLATSPDAKRGTFQVALDARLRSAVQGRLTRPPSTPSAEQPTLSVREIQARLRAGESAEDIAASAGVALERVERFAGPVWSEHEKMIEAARATPLQHSRRGLSALPLGEAVDLHFAQIDSLRPESVAWTARREDTGTWLVEVSYVARARTRSGSWRYDPVARTLFAADTVSASLGHSETAAANVASPSTAKRRGPASAKRPTGPAPSKRAATPAKVTAKAAPPPVAAPARPRRGAAPGTPRRAPAAVRTTVGTKAPPVVARPGEKTGGTTPSKKAVPAGGAASRRAPARGKTPAPKPPSAAKPAPDASSGLPAGAPTAPPTLRVVPALDQQPRQPPGRRPSASSRASVPAWADVLLSTSPPVTETRADQGEASSD